MKLKIANDTECQPRINAQRFFKIPNTQETASWRIRYNGFDLDWNCNCTLLTVDQSKLSISEGKREGLGGWKRETENGLACMWQSELLKTKKTTKGERIIFEFQFVLKIILISKQEYKYLCTFNVLVQTLIEKKCSKWKNGLACVFIIRQKKWGIGF